MTWSGTKGELSPSASHSWESELGHVESLLQLTVGSEAESLWCRQSIKAGGGTHIRAPPKPKLWEREKWVRIEKCTEEENGVLSEGAGKQWAIDIKEMMGGEKSIPL